MSYYVDIDSYNWSPAGSFSEGVQGATQSEVHRYADFHCLQDIQFLHRCEFIEMKLPVTRLF